MIDSQQRAQVQDRLSAGRSRAVRRQERASARAHELFAGHGADVERVCRSLLRDAAEAEDATQQTFLAAYRALLGGTEPRDPGAWLATIARHECFHRVSARRGAPMPTPELDEAPHPGDVHGEAVVNLHAERLRREIRRLPAAQRDAIVLREYAGLSYAELARELGVSRPAAHSLLVRARSTLRMRLRPEFAALNLLSLVAAIRKAIGYLGWRAGAASTATKAAVVTLAGGVLIGGGVVAEHELTKPDRVAAAPTVAAAFPASPIATLLTAGAGNPNSPQAVRPRVRRAHVSAPVAGRAPTTSAPAARPTAALITPGHARTVKPPTRVGAAPEPKRWEASGGGDSTGVAPAPTGTVAAQTNATPPAQDVIGQAAQPATPAEAVPGSSQQQQQRQPSPPPPTDGGVSAAASPPAASATTPASILPGKARKPDAPPAQGKNSLGRPPGLAKKSSWSPPGQAKKPDTTPPGLATKDDGLPPGLAAKPAESPPGQAKKAAVPDGGTAAGSGQSGQGQHEAAGQEQGAGNGSGTTGQDPGTGAPSAGGAQGQGQGQGPGDSNAGGNGNGGGQTTDAAGNGQATGSAGGVGNGNGQATGTAGGNGIGSGQTTGNAGGNGNGHGDAAQTATDPVAP